MNQFLKEATKVYQNLLANPKHYKKVRIVMGNESCDLDSAIASLVYAYIIYHENKQMGVRNHEILPLLNIPHEDFPLKTEVNFYLKLHNINVDHVQTRGCRDMLNLHKLHEAGVLELTLVDHHTLPAHDQLLIPAVVEVIDHRPQDPEWKWTTADVTIKPVGSCCTLIGRKILDRCPYLLTYQLCHLLHGPILLDTFNFSKEANRATELDHQVINALERKISVDRKRMFEDLIYAKTDISHLTDQQILRKDMKILSGIPVCGLPMLVQDFLERSHAEDYVVNFMKVQDAKLLVLMGLKVEEESVKKDIAVVSTMANLSCKAVDMLMSFDNPSLGLKEAKVPNVRFAKVFRQTNVSMSRKQIGPIIMNMASVYKNFFPLVR